MSSAWGVGLSTVDTHGEALDAWFPHLGLGPLPDPPPQLVGWTLAIDPRSLGGEVVTIEIDTDAPPASASPASLARCSSSKRSRCSAGSFSSL